MRVSRAHEILLRPILSEKGTSLAGAGKYVFAVQPRANKTEVKKSIQTVYEVHVEDVKIVKMPGKLAIFQFDAKGVFGRRAQYSTTMQTTGEFAWSSSGTWTNSYSGQGYWAIAC